MQGTDILINNGLLRHPHWMNGHMPRVAGVPHGWCYLCCRVHDHFVNIKPGSVRIRRAGHWDVTQPGDPLYSTALMAAEENYNGKDWEPIDGPVPDDGR